MHIMIIPPLAFHMYTFSCPGASASTYRTMFNTGSGIRHPYFVGSMTLNNPWNPAWLCILQKLRGEKKKRENIKLPISALGCGGNRSKEKLFSRTIPLHSPCWVSLDFGLPSPPLYMSCLIGSGVCFVDDQKQGTKIPF